MNANEARALAQVNSYAGSQLRRALESIKKRSLQGFTYEVLYFTESSAISLDVYETLVEELGKLGYRTETDKRSYISVYWS